MLPFWKIVGWFIYVSVYMIAAEGLYQWPKENITSVILKVLPVLQCLFIIYSSKSQEEGFASYRANIGLALLFSMAGDGLLVFEQHDRLGGVVFFVAHLWYLRALGCKPLGSLPVLLSHIVIGGSVAAYLYPYTEGIDRVLVPGYVALLSTMAWRANVRYITAPCTVNLLGCLGAFCFVASDAVLLSDWLVMTWQYAPVVVMVTYYLAQLGLALTATDDFLQLDYKEKTY